jgi:predicted TIM-barrel fold metal-dependent hydrolase
MIIDCHYHLDQDMVPLPNLIQSMDRHGIDRVALMARLTPPLALGSGLEGLVIPFFQWVVHNERNPLIGLVRRGYASTVKPDGTVSLASTEYRLYPQPDNDATMKACAEHPDRFYGWIVINPKGGADPIPELERCIKAQGMIGVKAHPYWYDFPVSMLEEPAAWCEKHGKPMIIHLGTKDRGDFRLLPEKFPGTRIIYCHAGVPYPNPVCAYAREKKNVYVDLAGSAFMNPGAALKAITLASAEKCLFGTDGPYHHDKGQMFEFGFYRNMINSLNLSDQERHKVFAENFLRILES